jgi:hypothetical protein
MAKLLSDILLSGTIGNITFYVRWRQTYMRKKSSLTAERVLEDAAFEKTRQYAKDLGLAARIASPVYKALPLEKKGRWMYRAIAGEAASLLYKGKTQEQATQFLWDKYIYNNLTKDDKEPRVGVTSFRITKKQQRLQLWKLFRDRWEEQGKPSNLFKYIWDRRGEFRSENIPKRLGLVKMV